MMNRTTILSLLSIALLSASGVGYAAFTSSVSVGATASAGTTVLVFSNSDGTTPASSSSYTSSYTSKTGVVTCTSTVSDGSLTVAVGNMAPGDTCTVTYYLKNTGTLPVNTFSASPASGAGFGTDSNEFTLTYNIPTGPLASGAHTAGNQVVITATTNVGQSETGTSPTLTITGTT